MTKMQSKYHLFQLTRMSQFKASPPRRGNRQPFGHTDKPRSYTIFNNEGNELRRNRTQIRPIPSPTKLHHESSTSTTTTYGPSINPDVSRQPTGNNETQKPPLLHNQQMVNAPVQMAPVRSKRVIKAPQRLDL
ncbi:hypothetical protein ElyMa_007031900 [Elysia marginata]|uniref:Uncharacterized protein n=1 Tax=Elysia marginata TaxID=1093978 RepID=A0AAV4JU98_9GAST|nr:hypothetical protein ElyMa_007031900 [Elysia marginata]